MQRYKAGKSTGSVSTVIRDSLMEKTRGFSECSSVQRSNLSYGWHYFYKIVIQNSSKNISRAILYDCFWCHRGLNKKSVARHGKSMEN